MTDLISAPNTGASDAQPTAPMPPSDGDQPVEWAPAEPAPKKRRVGLWVGIGAGALLLAAGGASTILIAPGTTVAGISVGWMTPGMAAETISSHLAQTKVTLTGAGKDATVNGAALGAQADATALADKAFSDHPMWNLGSWMGEDIPAKISLDAAAADRALRAAVPGSYTDAVDATVTFDKASGTYVVTDAKAGTGIDVDALSAAFVKAVGANKSSFEFSGAPTEAAASITTDAAKAAAEKLNAMLGTAGFYIGKERTVPIAPATLASWLSVKDVDGKLVVSADQSAIQTTVDTLAKTVDRPAVNATNIVDSGGKVLKTMTAGATGRVLGDTSKIASDFAAQLGDGKGVFTLPVTETPFESTNLVRKIEVDLSEQRTYLIENGKIVKSWAISSGRSGHDTAIGNFRIYAHVRIQDMRGNNGDGTKYLTKDVPWVTYFNGDQAFHGTYWHNNFGTPMSHGCVNMPIEVAKYVYEWAPTGLEVQVHA